LRCQCSAIKREVDWAKFTRRAWFEDSGTFDLFANDAVYGITFQNSAAEYEGETKVGTEKRAKTHTQKSWSKGKKHRLQRWLATTGSHKGTFTPHRTWNRPTTKVQRLKQEGRYIWERQGSLNESGTQSWQDKSNARWDVVFGRRQRFRLFARFEAKKRVTLLSGTE
jgi:hypothetical protein